MKAQILILGREDDPHIQWVRRGLRRYDCSSVYFDIRQYPHSIQQSIYCNPSPHMAVNGGVSLTPGKPFSAVWVRRAGRADTSAFDLDIEDREFVNYIHEVYDHELWSIINFVATDAATTWINPPSGSARASAKVLQIRAAHDVGLNVPPTLISNDPDSIRAFARENGQLICKSFVPKLWESEQGVFSKALTSPIDPEDRAIEESIRVQPAIYQPLIRKSYELRVLLLDSAVFAIRIDSQKESDLSLDWRRRPLARHLVSSVEIDAQLAEKLVAVMQSLGIRMGSFDLIVDVEGKIWFLEVNEAGQFLFLEDHCPELRILDAFCHLLVKGSLKDWFAESAVLRLADVKETN